MRKYIKQELVEIVKQLGKANKMLQEKIRILAEDQVMDLLTECQQSAIAIGEKIEETEGEGTSLVPLLEEYCEELYVLSTVLENSEQTDRVEGRIHILLNKILDSIQYEIPDSKQEVVFLPYKASMWDSLESVWMAADKDENCNAYVIPIPYFDKNPDGSLAQMYYEGNLYPDYVPVTHYENYDFEKNHPDVIYIHNPYDEYNFVTSVHPAFYARNLKQYTDKLVYIPYFVCTDSIKEECCLQAGITYADKVIVQSDTIQNEYIRNCRKIFGKRISGEKFIVGGAPKFDKIIKTITSGVEVPEDWLNRVKGKKVVLYNTHLNTLLKYEEAAIKKIKSVFTFFSERDDVVLLWRPHPLSKPTLQAMRPGLYEQYCELEQNFRENKVGIYDESADMYPAISAADAYYGDSSSLITIFGVTGRPICLQNVEVKDNSSRGQRFEGAYTDGNMLYFANMEYNALCSMNLANGQIEHLGEFPEIERNQRRITQNIGSWNQKLWMLPFDSEKVYAYDLKTGKWACYSLPAEWPKDCKRNVIFAGAQVGKYYYGFCAGRYGVMRLDMESGEIDYSRDGLELYKKKITPGKSKLVCRQDCCVVGEKIYVACMAGNLVLEYDTTNTKITTYSVGNENNRYITICYDGNCFWLTEIFGKILKWNPKTKEEKEISIAGKNAMGSGGQAYASSLYADGYVWLFAYCTKENIRINVTTGAVETVYSFADEEISGSLQVTKSWYADGVVYFVNANKCTLVKINTLTLETQEIKISTTYEGIRWMWEPKQIDIYSDCIQRESNLFNKNIGGLVDYLLLTENTYNEQQRKCFLKFTKYPEGNSGEVIHQKMMEKDW